MADVKISKEDIISVAKDLKFPVPNEDGIKYIINNIGIVAECDPTGNFKIWIERLLEEVIDIPFYN